MKLSTDTHLQEQGISILNKAIEACTAEIERHKGKLTVKEAPRAVSITLSMNSYKNSMSCHVHPFLSSIMFSYFGRVSSQSSASCLVQFLGLFLLSNLVSYVCLGE